MVNLTELTDWMNNYLGHNNFLDDQALNGLQVEASDEIKTIALATDASISVFEKAKADLMITHHGLYWTRISPVIAGEMANRVRYLMDHKMSLYASHLPLDAHSEVGNNAELIRALGLIPKSIEGSVSFTTNFKGNFDELLQRAAKLEEPTFVGQFGPEDLNEITVCTGMGTNLLFSVKPNTTFITGEFNHHGYHYALENHINVIALGHYFTETYGVKAIGKKLEENFGVKTEFIDLPTGI
ncbi:MAG: Nif3-like dinuclear metal center hexameric protein [Candidatus Altiarchaeota archaeon]|nr:Nif3-like dinuclear metal center hexameric protein [Candidatus Altiarchaeota archaeon]